MVPLVIAVEALGGEYIEWDSKVSQATVEIAGKIIEYRKNNTKYWVDNKRKTSNEKAQIISGKLYVELKTILNVTNQVANYKDGYIVIANDWASQEEIQEVIDYLFGKTASKDYDKSTEKEEATSDIKLSDIKAGKVYATDKDGIHIYKRTYDPTNELNYNDVYVCTIANFALPKNAVLTLKGNYLYQNDEKVCADIDTLRESEKRINQLNEIIEGANNAYNVGNINKTRKNEIKADAESAIAEYQKVMEGSKTLSKVSERK